MTGVGTIRASGPQGLGLFQIITVFLHLQNKCTVVVQRGRITYKIFHVKSTAITVIGNLRPSQKYGIKT